MRTKFVFAAVAAVAVLGSSGLALAQTGLANRSEPSDSGYGETQQPTTTGSVTYEERQAPGGRYTNARPWQGFDPSRNLPETPIVPMR